MKKGIEQIKKTAKEINLEMAGMSNLYTLNQDKVKIRFQITKHIEIKTLHECTDYKELFVDTLDQSPLKRMRFQYRGRKILVKGRIGTGKSVLAKKILLDWSKGAFAAFPLVFRVDLNLAQPDDTIESIIQRLSNGVVLELEKLKSNILVIIDGFDNRNVRENVLRFVEDRGRNVLVTTSDYHLAELIEGHFDTVATLQGFSKEDAQEFLASLDAGPNVQSVLSVKVSLPSVLESSDGINPMVTTLLAVLVNNNKLEPETKTISFCEVCYKLLRLLYSSSSAAARNGDDANKAKEEESFMYFAKEMGKLALDRFQLEKFKIEDNCVYDWLMRKGTNGFLSFTNRCFEVFLAALYFVFEVKDEGIESVIHQNSQGHASGVIFDPFFMNFCLTLLSEQKSVSVPQKETTRDKMEQYVKEKIDLVQLDFHDVASKYPACDISHSKDEVVLQFLLDVVKSCEQIQDLILVPSLPVGKILNAVNITSPKLKAILLVEEDHIVLDKVMKNIEPEILSIVVDNQVGEPLDELFYFLNTVGREFSIHYIGGDKSTPMIDFALFAIPNLSHLHIYKKDRLHCDLVARQALPKFPSLQSLEVASHEVRLGRKMIEALVNALGQNHFPQLSFCSLIGGHLTKLNPLFQGDWATLQRLHLKNEGLHEDTLKSFCSKILPNLVSLEIGRSLLPIEDPIKNTLDLYHLRICGGSCNLEEYFDLFKKKHFQKIVSLELEVAGFPEKLLDTLTKETFPELHELVLQGLSGLSNVYLPDEFAQNGVIVTLTRLELFNCHLPSVSIFSENCGLTNLEKLTLVDCGLYPNDIRYLAQANADGLLPKLKDLDISDNRSSGGSKHLFDFNSRWENMLCLNIERTDEQSYGAEVFDNFLHLTQKSLSGCLGSLEELIVTTENPDYVPKIKRQCWPRLKSVKISSHALSWKQVLSPLADLVDRGGDEVLPSLEVVTFCLPARKPPTLALERQLLRRNGVRVYFTTRSMY